MPSSLLLDLRPRGHDDFYRVHARCFQNPHALVRVAAQQKLSRVIEHLGRRNSMLFWTEVKVVNEYNSLVTKIGILLPRVDFVFEVLVFKQTK